MADILSIWRSPLDKVAISEAERLSSRQPNCSIVFSTDFELMTMYNYGSFVGNYGHIASWNTSKLAIMFSTMNTGQTSGGIGGMAFIPQYNFPVNASSSGLMVPDQCNIVGSGGGGPGESSAPDFFHFTIAPPTGATAPSYFFYCADATGPPAIGHTCGGKYFRSLAFEWATTSYADVCIYAGTWNCRAVKCTFTNCPVAFKAVGESSGLEQCTIQYSGALNGSGPSGTNAFAAVSLSASQCFAVGPSEFLQPSQQGGGAPTDTCCISFESGLEHGIVRDMHISHWSYGITYGISSTGNINHCMVSNVEFATFGSSYGGGTCVHMVPSSTTQGKIYDQKYTSCAFSLGDSSTNTNPLVYIDTNTQGNDTVNDIQFIGCDAFQGLGHGYQINGGSNIQIIGGTSAGNGPSGGAGIAITGACGGCSFIGVNLNTQYPGSGLQSQKYAFLCSASPNKPILLDGCFMEGYSGSGPVEVTGSPTSLLIINCPGYNDLSTSILSGTTHLPISGAVSASNASTITGGTNYYGPSLVIFTNNSNSLGLSFTINGVSQTVPANAFVTCYLASPYDTIQFGHTLTAFAWVGK